MRLIDLHDRTSLLSVIPLKKNGEGTFISIHLEKDGELKKHKTAVPAVLICVSGEVVYETENGETEVLLAGHYVHIAPDVEHWLLGKSASELVLMK